MKRLTIEWRHLDKEGNTCVRCAETGHTLQEVVAELAAECAPKGVQILFRETKLSEKEIQESNLILLNGVPMEQVLSGAIASTTPCGSCCDMIGAQTACRTVEYGGKSYEAIPAELIREAVCRVAQCC